MSDRDEAGSPSGVKVLTVIERLRDHAPADGHSAAQAKTSTWSLVVESLIVAAAYFIAGWLAINHVLTPGFAAAVWPAAGIALVATLRRHASGFLGTWLGSSVLNFNVITSAALGPSPVDTVAMALIIGTANALQAFVGARLILRSVRQPRLLLLGRDVLLFMLLGGPVACMISASVGVSVHLYAGLMSPEAGPLRWVTWWAGASLGVAIFGPLTLIVLERREGTWRRRWRSVGLPVLVAFATTTIAVLAVERWEARLVAKSHEQDVLAMNAALHEQLERHRKALVAMAGFFEFSERVTPSEFARMARHLSKLTEHARAAYWFERTPGTSANGNWQVEPLFAMDQQDADEFGFAEFEPDDWDTDFIPTPIKTPAVSGELLRQAMLTSIQTGQPVMTESVRGTDDLHPRQAVAAIVMGVFLPSLNDGKQTDPVESRMTQLRGFVVFELDLSELGLEVTASEGREGGRIAVYDVTDSTRPPVMVVRTSESGVRDDLLEPDAEVGASLVRSESATSSTDVRSKVPFAGRVFAVRSVLASTAARRTMESYTVLMSGLVLTSLLGGFLLVLSGHAARVEQTVHERTTELRRLNARLARERQSVHRMNRDLKRSRDAARAAVRAKTAFLANMSHEIRTPMTAILGFTELLADPGIVPSQRDEYAEVVRRNGEHLLAIINDILDVSKIDAGKLRLERVPCELRTIVSDVVSLMQVSAARKGIAFVVDSVPQNVPRRVLTDPTRVRQVLFNLLSNAIKFTEHGSVRLSVRLLSASGAPGMPCRIQFDVVDTGIGMKPSQVAGVFRAFSQADASTTRRYGGTGLGLTISVKLVEMLGGKMVVDSEPGRGSTFTFDIAAEIAPASSGTRATSLPMTVANDVRRETREGRTRARALVVDDGEDNRTLVRVYLTRLGFEVAEAVDGRDGVEQVLAAQHAGNAFDLVLLDMQMPVMDGWEAARQMRREGVQTPIIAVTAGALSDDRERCIEAGCDAYAAKPIDLDELQRAVQRFVPRRPVAVDARSAA